MAVRKASKQGDLARLGEKVRALRRQREMSQAQLAERLGISGSYLNLIEANKRPLPATMLLRVASELGVDLGAFSSEVDTRAEQALREVFGDPLFEPNGLTNADVRELVAAAPNAAQAVLSLYRAYKSARESTDTLAARMHDDEAGAITLSRAPTEEVNDLIQARMNHFPDLEAQAERLVREARLETDDMFRGLAQWLQRTHGIEVTVVRSVDERGTLRRYDPAMRRLYLSELLPTRSRSFQLAHQIGLLEARPELDRICEDPLLTSPESRALARVALANYVASAVLMPYTSFLRAARDERYDLDVLSRRFRVGFEQVCHRVTTLRRQGAEGVPFHMMRIDVAGNISKRFSASGIGFARFSGACPKWNVFVAFNTPGMIRIQVSEMPDGQKYFCLARTVQKDASGYLHQHPLQAIGLGCKVEHASELVYADGVDLSSDRIPIEVGVTCRSCERNNCAQRAHPSVRHPLSIDENLRGPTIYTSARSRGG
nr:DUF2083 domain-containing protein [Deltaproteobacteria bacterium]